MSLRVGVVSYLNTAPLLFSLRQTAEARGWSIVEDHPANLNRRLAAGELDLALVSSLEYAENAPQYLLLPDVSISATGRVGSVILFSSSPLNTLTGKTVVLTRASATSVALLKLLLEDFYGQRPVYQSGTLKDAHQAAAYLAIGDEALRLRHHPPFAEAHDLAALWMERTHLPFVFAVFAVREEAWQRDPWTIREFAKELYLSRARGLASLSSLANQCQEISGLSAGECLLYLKGIEYDLSGLKQEALLVFFRHLARRGEISASPPLRFLKI